MPNKLSQFWQELRRRNVTRVLAVYIAAAFMILELVDMTSDPFGLPDWSMKVAFLILIAGLIIVVIVSWIYDIHPKEGIIKNGLHGPINEIHSFLIWTIISKGQNSNGFIKNLLIVVCPRNDIQ